MDRIATFHVVRERPRRQLVVMTRMLSDRRHLRQVDGLTFAKVLGAGRSDDTGPSADLRRQAYFLVWRDVEAARAFLATHPVARRWQELEVERALALGLVSGRGTWSRQPILDGMNRTGAGRDEDEDEGGDEIVVLTRARIRLRHWWAFRRASRATAVGRPDGRRWVIAVGELPFGLLGTVSGWRSSADLDAWLADDAVHADAMSSAGEWFAESLFARFAPVAIAGERSAPERPTS